MLEKNPDNVKKIVKTELSFYIHTHKVDRPGRPELFRLTNINTEQMAENLLIMLPNEDGSGSRSSIAEISLPTKEDALRIVKASTTGNIVKHPPFEVNEPCDLAHWILQISDRG